MLNRALRRFLRLLWRLIWRGALGFVVLSVALVLLFRFVPPPGSMVMGSPGKVVRQLGEDELDWIRSRWNYYADYTERFLADSGEEVEPEPLS